MALPPEVFKYSAFRIKLQVAAWGPSSELAGTECWGFESLRIHRDDGGKTAGRRDWRAVEQDGGHCAGQEGVERQLGEAAVRDGGGEAAVGSWQLGEAVDAVGGRCVGDEGVGGKVEVGGQRVAIW